MKIVLWLDGWLTRRAEARHRTRMRRAKVVRMLLPDTPAVHLAAMAQRRARGARRAPRVRRWRERWRQFWCLHYVHEFQAHGAVQQCARCGVRLRYEP